MKNRHGQDVELDTISKVVIRDGGVEVDRESGWGTLWIGNDELDGFVPQVGDAFVLMTTNLSYVHGIIIENRVIRYRTAEQVEKARKEMLDGFRLERLERYVKEGDGLKERAKALPLPLRERMERFAAKDGVEFWIESAGYEMAVLEGAAALLRKVNVLGFIHSSHANFGVEEGDNDDITGAIDWINDWWSKGYEEQMRIVPDFGDGHSGFTASAAKSMAIAVLEGEPV